MDLVNRSSVILAMWPRNFRIYSFVILSLSEIPSMALCATLNLFARWCLCHSECLSPLFLQHPHNSHSWPIVVIPLNSRWSIYAFPFDASRVATLIFETYKPDVCIVQCGGDAIVGDPLGNTNLTPIDLGKCIETTLNWTIPTIFLGGGGYNTPNTARYWTYLTSVICRTTIGDDIPDDHNDYFLMYGPGYELSIEAKELSDANTGEEFERNYKAIQGERLVDFSHNALIPKTIPFSDHLVKYEVRDVWPTTTVVRFS